jgi:uncharacterized repeat protein (TIGR03803 family)
MRKYSDIGSNSGVGPGRGAIAFAAALNLLAGIAAQANAATETVLHSFGNGNDGQNPYTTLISIHGMLYGTTLNGGDYGGGTVFSITPSGGETVLYSFGNGTDASHPFAGLTNLKGALYGTSWVGGDIFTCGSAYGCGTVFSITSGGSETVLHSFGSGSDGWAPYYGSLIRVKGALYGTTEEGGSYGYGTVFSIKPDGTETVLYSFGSGSDGQAPLGGLINLHGTLYGLTAYGGTYGHGTVFSITRNGTEKVLHSFAGNSGGDGAEPVASLTNVKGTLYGTTYEGGAYKYGTVFSITRDGTETVLYSFGSGSDGRNPAGVLITVKGTLYGTTQNGGANSDGTVFSITTDGTETLLYSFGTGSDGHYPQASLKNIRGTLYGTTVSGGSYDLGTVFSIVP